MNKNLPYGSISAWWRRAWERENAIDWWLMIDDWLLIIDYIDYWWLIIDWLIRFDSMIDSFIHSFHSFIRLDYRILIGILWMTNEVGFVIEWDCGKSVRAFVFFSRCRILKNPYIVPGLWYRLKVVFYFRKP